MTEEIVYYDEELAELIQSIEDGVDGLARKRHPAKSEAIHELEERMKRAKQVLQSFKVEMRELSRDQQHIFDQKHKEHHSRLQALSGDLQIARGDADRQNLGVRSADEMTTGELLDVASRTQDQSLASVNRMKQRIAESRQVGTETADRLRGQTEQLKGIDVDIMKVKTNLNRADVLIRAFVRKMMTDKIIMILVCLIFLGIVGIIIYRVVDPDGEIELSTSSNSAWNSQVYSANQNSRALRDMASQNLGALQGAHNPSLVTVQRRTSQSVQHLVEALERLLHSSHD